MLRISALLTACAGATLLLLAGCATLNSITTTETVAINQALTIGAEVYISKAGGTAVPPALYSTAQQARAQKLKNWAVQIQGTATGTVTLAQLDAALQKWQLSLKTPLEQGEAAALIAAINLEVSTRVTSGVIGAAATAVVSDVTNDFIAAAKVYGAV
jgi:hypothetical protein